MKFMMSVILRCNKGRGKITPLPKITIIDNEYENNGTRGFHERKNATSVHRIRTYNTKRIARTNGSVRILSSTTYLILY
jgi:hypothetical protein